MNASLARRIRNAEAILISAITARTAGGANGANTKQLHHRQQPRFSVPNRNENRMIVRRILSLAQGEK